MKLITPIKKFVGKQNIATKLVVVFALTTSIVFTVSSVITKAIFETVLFRNTYDVTIGSLCQTEYNINEKLDSFEKVALQIMISEQLHDLAFSDDLESVYSYREINAFNKLALSSLSHFEDIVSIVYCNQDYYMIGTDRFITWREPATLLQRNSLKAVSDARYGESETATYTGMLNSNILYSNKSNAIRPYENYISIIVNCKFSSTPFRGGTLIINCKESAFKSIFSKMFDPNTGNMYVVENDGKVISSTNDASIGKEYSYYSSIDTSKKYQYFAHEKSTYTIAYQVDRTDWQLVLDIPLQFFYKNAYELYQILIWFVFLSLAIIFILYFVYVKILLRPLQSLKMAMAVVGQGKYGLTLDQKGHGEIEEVINSFNTMSKDIEILTNDNIRINDEKKTLQLLALQEQMNPHFVLNALNTIKWMALIAKEQNIVEMVISLSKVIYAFRNDDAFCTVEKEIDFVKNYISVMNFRYGNVIHVKYEIEDTILQHRIPMFIIQPLVENSLKHGFETTNYQGHITIQVFAEKELICIRIRDDGKGIPEQLLYELNERLGKPLAQQKNENNGIGLMNIAKRLKLYYGETYGVSVGSAADSGTEVVITLPDINNEHVDCSKTGN